MRRDYRETRWYLAAQVTGLACVAFVVWALVYTPWELARWEKPLMVGLLWVFVLEALVRRLREWRTRREVSAFIRAYRWARPFREEDDR